MRGLSILRQKQIDGREKVLLFQKVDRAQKRVNRWCLLPRKKWQSGGWEKCWT